MLFRANKETIRYRVSDNPKDLSGAVFFCSEETTMDGDMATSTIPALGVVALYSYKEGDRDEVIVQLYVGNSLMVDWACSVEHGKITNDFISHTLFLNQLSCFNKLVPNDGNLRKVKFTEIVTGATYTTQLLNSDNKTLKTMKIMSKHNNFDIDKYLAEVIK